MRLLAFLILIPILIAHSLCADESLALRKGNPENDLLVLNSGRVVKGKLTPRTGGYDVTLSAGRMFVGSDQIRFKAINMEEAYQRMRESFTELTPTSHIDLARWCINNQLPGHARRELLDALHLDPYHTDAKRMLEGILREQNRATQVASPVIPQYDPLAPERRSLGGLTQDMARTFTRNIQPLISGKCGNARCHGAGRNTFAIVSVRGSATAYTTEQNLAAVLNQIDFKDPINSPIMDAATRLHGGSHQLFFRGQSGRRQIDLLRDWITEVAQQVSPSKTLSHGGDGRQSSPEPVNASTFGDEDKNSARSDTKFVKDAVAATRNDAFDPEIFNQRFHGIQRNANSSVSQ